LHGLLVISFLFSQVWCTKNAETPLMSDVCDPRALHPLYVTTDLFETPMEGLRHQNPLPVFDDYIAFDDAKHLYYLRQEVQIGDPALAAQFSRVFVSSTGFIHGFFPHFDADEAIGKMRNGRNWTPQNKYWGMSDEEIKAGWEKNRDEAARAGTRMHELIEWFYEYPDFVTEQHIEYMANAFDMPELLQFLNFHRSEVVPRGWKPFRTELRAFSRKHNLAGSVDMIYITPEGKLVVVDWKRSKEIKKQNRYQQGLGPLKHLDDCNFVHYALQLNLYHWMLITYLQMPVDSLYLAVFHPNQQDYQMIQVPPMQMEIEAMLEQRFAEEQVKAADLCMKAVCLLSEAHLKHSAAMNQPALLAEMVALGQHLVRSQCIAGQKKTIASQSGQKRRRKA